MPVSVPSVVIGRIDDCDQYAPIGVDGSIDPIRSSAPMAFTEPAPWVRASAAGIGTAVNWRIPLMKLAVTGTAERRRCSSMRRAMTPVVTAAAWLVPFRRR
jgi:hypothetical protein